MTPPRPKRVLALQHADGEGLGTIADALDVHGVHHDCIRPDLGERVPTSLGAYDGLLIMGGPQGVYEEQVFPFLKSEKKLIRNALKRRKPVIGICLGSQLVAATLGARVYPGTSFEVGWKNVRLVTDVSKNPVLSALPAHFKAFHWHGDVFDLPLGACLVASSEMSAVQAFAFDRLIYGFLFHLEMTLEQLNSLVAAFPGDLKCGGETPRSILENAEAYASELRPIALEVFGNWAQLL